MLDSLRINVAELPARAQAQWEELYARGAKGHAPTLAEDVAAGADRGFLAGAWHQQWNVLQVHSMPCVWGRDCIPSYWGHLRCMLKGKWHAARLSHQSCSVLSKAHAPHMAASTPPGMLLMGTGRQHLDVVVTIALMRNLDLRRTQAPLPHMRRPAHGPVNFRECLSGTRRVPARGPASSASSSSQAANGRTSSSNNETVGI